MSAKTLKILEQFKTELERDFQRLSGGPNVAEHADVVEYLGVHYSKMQQQIFNAIECLKKKENENGSS